MRQTKFDICKQIEELAKQAKYDVYSPYRMIAIYEDYYRKDELIEIRNRLYLEVNGKPF